MGCPESEAAEKVSLGASSWWYEVDYREDVAEALAEVKQRVFSKGGFYHPWKRRRWVPNSDELDEMIAAAAAPGLTPEELRASATRLMRGRRPLSVEHLLALAGEEGTHSILDMFGLGDGFGEVAPLDLSEYDRLFGTLTPTMKQVKARKR